MIYTTMMMNSQRLARHTHCVVEQPHTTTTTQRKNVVSGFHGSVSDVPGTMVHVQQRLLYPIQQKAMPAPPRLPLPFHHRRQQQQQPSDLSILSMSLLDDDNQSLLLDGHFRRRMASSSSVEVEVPHSPTDNAVHECAPVVLEHNKLSFVAATTKEEEEEEEDDELPDFADLLLYDQDLEFFANLMLEEENDGHGTVDDDNNRNILEEEEEEEINLIPIMVKEEDDEPNGATASFVPAFHCGSSPNRSTSSKSHKLSTTCNEALVVVVKVMSGTENGGAGIGATGAAKAATATATPVRLRAAQMEQWEQRFQELIQFR
jgi:hypothetical protein